jgi:uncharacterized protein YqjF (DUF2071 family)
MSRISAPPNWTIEQRWSHTLFVNWKVSPQSLQPSVPFPLDLHQGQAVLSVVPFRMDRVRFRGLPGALTTWTSLWEINLRTYVKVGGISGIYFLTLETPHRLANFVARTAFRLPYRYARMKVKHQPGGGCIDAQVTRPGGGLQPLGLIFERETGLRPSLSADPFQVWVTERYHLFVEKNGRSFRGDVHHEPWRVRRVKVQALSGGIATVSRLPDPSRLEPCYEAGPLRVRFEPFLEITHQSRDATKIP